MRVIKEDNKVRMENENKELGVFSNIIFLFFNNLKNKFRILISLYKRESYNNIILLKLLCSGMCGIGSP